MNTICLKIKKLHRLRIEFGWKMWLLKVISILYPYRKHNNRIARNICFAKSKKVLSILEKDYRGLAKSWAVIEPHEKPSDIIWTFWWQGIDNAPESVKNCIRNMKRFSNGNQVIVITKNNIYNYIDLPQCIYDKVKKGILTFTHLSDIVRVNLLYKYGGLWLDSGIFPIKPIEKQIFDTYYWSRKAERHSEANIADSRWCVGLLAGKPGGGYYGFMTAAFNLYWVSHDVQLDYFLIDYLTELAYQYIDKFKISIDQLSVSNRCLYEAETALNMPVEEYKKFGELMKENTFLRLKWRKQYIPEDKKGRRTLYGEFFEYGKQEGIDINDSKVQT